MREIKKKLKKTGGWKDHVCQGECQCHDLREGRKKSLSGGFIWLSICSRFVTKGQRRKTPQVPSNQNKWSPPLSGGVTGDH